MGIFKRTRDIISANLNMLLDQAENPEAMVNQIIRELEGAISDLRCNATAKIADKKTLERKIEALEKEIARWEERAELAVKSAKDELAKEALREKGLIEKSVEALKNEFLGIDEYVEDSKKQVREMEEKLVEMVNKKKDLLLRLNKAEERRNNGRILNRAKEVEISEKFSSFESRIERMEAEAEIFSSSASNEFEKMEAESQIDEELKAMKEKLKGL